jgi:peptide/nickel transport system substrate-binding protein
MGKQSTSRRLAVVAVAAALVLAACGGGGEGAATTDGEKGGTIYFLTEAEQILHLDPQRNYTGEDMAFAVGYLHRTLTQYKYSTDAAEANSLEPDMATDTGTSEEGGKVWKFTLKDGLKWEDGDEVTCEQVKYGVSRTFAQDVITDGPTFAISLLDGVDDYKGPYDTSAGNDVAAFDNAVSCEDKTITFRLRNAMSDFNYAVTLTAFAPVKPEADTGEKYDERPLSNGPYKIESYAIGKELVLVRNDQWDASTDTLRTAFPDRIVYKFGLDASVIDQRLIADSGDDQFAAGFGVEPGSLATIFSDDPRFTDRRVDELDPYVRFFFINTQKVPNLKHRQAIAAAWPRAEWLTIAGGEFAGTLADGVIKPLLAQDYQPTNMWNVDGTPIPDNGDTELAKKLIADSGEPMPALTIDYPQSPTNEKSIGALVTAFQKAGIKLTPNPLEPGGYYGYVFDEAKQGALSSGGWGPDWPNASTVIPEIYGKNGGFNLSRIVDPAFDAKIEAARVIEDRVEQGKAWAALNTEASAQFWVIPTRFGKAQRIWGSKLGNSYLWAPYGSYPYGVMFVKK